MKLADIMSKPVVTVEMDDRLSEVRRLLDSCHFHHLLVVDAGLLVGVISDRDLLRAISPNLGTAAESAGDLATLNKRAHQIMSRDPITVSAEDTVTDAVDLLCQHAISCLPVVSAENKPLGVVSWRDLMRAFADDAAIRDTMGRL
ncbi:CBS domain-containing protein [Spongiibacter nanhainus]|uniref:CBS domain-containing protein n=1 Tax=Spongiibacter nanhainus TaxID=2794344 RepID=A0A7T4QZZ3_9GAMM|nr:CBS domain-containing protein [Spongiibacter nanhainus]QQD17896.1 CBS domain-containing protein [Spongiibacter nanhainus]